MPGPVGMPLARPRRVRTRRCWGAQSPMTSATVAAPRSCARPSSRTSTSAVASASGRARWHGRTSVSNRSASEPRFMRSSRSPSSRRARATVSITGAASRPLRRRARIGVDEPDVEAGVVGDEHGAGAEPQELVEHGPHPRPPADVMLGDAGDLRDLGGNHAAGVDEPLHPRRLAEAAHADGPQLDDARDAGPGAGGLEVEDDVVGQLERRVEQRRDLVPLCEGHLARRTPHEPRVSPDDLVDQLMHERGGGASQREEARRRLAQPDRCATRAQELVQAVRAVERELRDRGHRTYVRIRRGRQPPRRTSMPRLPQPEGVRLVDLRQAPGG